MSSHDIDVANQTLQSVRTLVWESAKTMATAVDGVKALKRIIGGPTWYKGAAERQIEKRVNHFIRIEEVQLAIDRLVAEVPTTEWLRPVPDVNKAVGRIEELTAMVPPSDLQIALEDLEAAMQHPQSSGMKEVRRLFDLMNAVGPAIAAARAEVCTPANTAWVNEVKAVTNPHHVPGGAAMEYPAEINVRVASSADPLDRFRNEYAILAEQKQAPVDPAKEAASFERARNAQDLPVSSWTNVSAPAPEMQGRVTKVDGNHRVEMRTTVVGHHRAAVLDSLRDRDISDGPANPGKVDPPDASVAVIHNDEGKVLAVYNKHLRGWALPGGKHEPGEDALQALVREVREETSLETIFAVKVHEGKSVTGSGRTVHAFMAITTGEPHEMEEGSPWRWMTIAELSKGSPYALFYADLFAAVYAK